MFSEAVTFENFVGKFCVSTVLGLQLLMRGTTSKQAYRVIVTLKLI